MQKGLDRMGVLQKKIFQLKGLNLKRRKWKKQLAVQKEEEKYYSDHLSALVEVVVEKTWEVKISGDAEEFATEKEVEIEKETPVKRFEY